MSRGRSLARNGFIGGKADELDAVVWSMTVDCLGTQQSLHRLLLLCRNDQRLWPNDICDLLLLLLTQRHRRSIQGQCQLTGAWRDNCAIDTVVGQERQGIQAELSLEE